MMAAVVTPLSGLKETFSRVKNKGPLFAVTFFGCASIIAMVACGVTVVHEYHLSIPYVATSCRVATHNMATSELVRCKDCQQAKGKKHKKKKCENALFPCLKLKVDYLDKRNVTQQGLLHPSSTHVNGQYSKCSFHACADDRDANDKTVRAWLQGYLDIGESWFPCFYHKDEYDKVIREKKYTWHHVFHCYFWPGLVLLACVVGFLRIKTKDGTPFCPGGTTEAPLAKNYGANHNDIGGSRPASPVNVQLWHAMGRKHLSTGDLRKAEENRLKLVGSAKSLRSLNHLKPETCAVTIPLIHAEADASQDTQAVPGAAEVRPAGGKPNRSNHGACADMVTSLGGSDTRPATFELNHSTNSVPKKANNRGYTRASLDDTLL